MDVQLGLLDSEGFPEDVIQLSLGFDYSAYLDEQDGSEVLPEEVDQPKLYTAFTTLGLRQHLGEGWSGELSLPVGLVTLEPGDNVATERITGFGDLELAARYDLQALWGRGDLKPSLSLKLGLVLPTGTQTLLAAGIPGIPPSVVSLGWGAFGVSAAADLTWFLASNFALIVPVSVRAPLSRNSNNFRFGPVVSYGLQALVVANQTFAVAGGLSGVHRGVTNEETEGETVNSGGDKLSAELTVRARLTDNVAIGVRGRLPLWQQVNGVQVVETFGVGGFLSLSFGDDDDDDEDEHDHGHGHGEHDHGEGHEHGAHGPKPDVRDLAKGGATFLMGDAFAPGKVTVIDFWAQWCEPCHEITRRLSALAAKRPDLAVRRVEVPDFDTKVAKIHLPGVNALPVVWVYDRELEQVAALQSPTPDQVMAAVEEALGPAPGAHEGHGEHEGHEHGEHEGHEHGEHEGHEHGEHEGHEHGEHEGHEHGEHEGHEHGAHEGHDH